ncbi:LysR family transcriptional regulator [Bacterioplanoides sp.]|uniref:LysR family transcriptional regulator n=1 Tax=Bacterioplanoides sp. TaxID=2066072 RepID=UPI003B5B16E2
MDRITAARVFVEIIDQGSMIAAAEKLDMSRSKVTRYLNEFEQWANARLLHRSTRRLSLTDAGEQVLEQCRELLRLADEIPLSEQTPGLAVRGHLRISCAHYAAEHILLAVLPQYRQRYPQVSLELQINNATVDLVEQRVDLAIRIAAELDPNLIARKLGECPSVLCASPGYLKQHGTPATLAELQQHQCLIYSHFDRHNIWRFQYQGEQHSQAVGGDLISGDSMILLKAAVRDMGITYQPKADAQPYLERGELVEILPQFQPTTLTIYGVYHSRKQMPQALRLLLDALAQQSE